jgi:hypothetical protein
MISGKEKDKSPGVVGSFVLFGCLGSSDIRFTTEYALNKIGKLMGMGIECTIVFGGKRPFFKDQRDTPGRHTWPTDQGTSTEPEPEILLVSEEKRISKRIRKVQSI